MQRQDKTGVEGDTTRQTVTNTDEQTIEQLQATVARLRVRLWYVRRAYADLLAACRAALLAHGEGEPDPWWYLRDELPPAPDGHPLGDAREHPGGGAGR